VNDNNEGYDSNRSNDDYDDSSDSSELGPLSRIEEFVAPASRRRFMATTAKVGGVLALAGAGTGTAAAGGSGTNGEEDGDGDGDEERMDDESEDVSDLDVLNYALTLEQLEAAYYNEFLEEYSESEVERSEAARVFADPGSRFGTYQKIEEVRDHEEAHVEALTGTIEDLGGEPVEPLEYDFPYESIEAFAELSATIEAVGVSAYAGAAPLIDSDDVLAAALSIHSVEARHTAYFRVLTTMSPFSNGFDPARSMDEVLEIASQFIVGMDGDGAAQRFSVHLENVSKPGTIDSDRAMGAVPLSPPVWAVFTGENPAFVEGEDANAGTEIVAEDGFPTELAGIVADAENVSQSGVAPSPGGSLETPALGPGEAVEFTFDASPGDMLTLETMFVQSNDWFYGFDGLRLFDDDEPIEGTVTSHLGLYDAGTEEDTAPGTGPNQKPAQDPEAMGVGPDEDEPIQLAEERHPDFDIPDASEVIEVTVTPE
jgi:hypothetical protein